MTVWVFGTPRSNSNTVANHLLALSTHRMTVQVPCHICFSFSSEMNNSNCFRVNAVCLKYHFHCVCAISIVYWRAVRNEVSEFASSWWAGWCFGLDSRKSNVSFNLCLMVALVVFVMLSVFLCIWNLSPASLYFISSHWDVWFEFDFQNHFIWFHISHLRTCIARGRDTTDDEIHLPPNLFIYFTVRQKITFCWCERCTTWSPESEELGESIYLVKFPSLF